MCREVKKMQEHGIWGREGVRFDDCINLTRRLEETCKSEEVDEALQRMTMSIMQAL